MKNQFYLPILSSLVLLFASCSQAQTDSNLKEHSADHIADVEVTPIAEVVKYVEPADFYIGMGSRFWPISKSELSKFTDVKDFIGEEEMERQTTVEATALIVIENE